MTTIHMVRKQFQPRAPRILSVLLGLMVMVVPTITFAQSARQQARQMASSGYWNDFPAHVAEVPTSANHTTIPQSTNYSTHLLSSDGDSSPIHQNRVEESAGQGGVLITDNLPGQVYTLGSNHAYTHGPGCATAPGLAVAPAVPGSDPKTR